MNRPGVSPSAHWDGVYSTKAVKQVSWYESRPTTSLRLVSQAASAGRVVDVGAGASGLADILVTSGYRVTVLDVSARALDHVRERLGVAAAYVVADVLDWRPVERFDVWHDRAVFHFLTVSADQRRYVESASATVDPGGAVVMGTFAPNGPESCSGLSTARHDANSLERLFDDAFTLDHAEEEDHVTPWGALQPFTWVLLRRKSSTS